MITTALLKPKALKHRTLAGMQTKRLGIALGTGLTVLTAGLTGSAQAEELLPIQNRAIAIGPVNGAAYYTNDAAGSHLVATLDGDEGSAPMRVSTTLIAGQSMTLSVPARFGEPAIEVTFSRRGNRVFVDGGDGLLLEVAK